MAAPDTLMLDRGELARNFAPLSSRRLLVLAGIAMILAGMIFGDIFAIFILHENAARAGGSLGTAVNAALHGIAGPVGPQLAESGKFLENRGTKVDTHVHLIGFGYLALMLGIIQPWVRLSERTKKRAAWLFVCGAVLLPVGVFLIHYVGLAYSPLNAMGWASIFADLGGLMVLLATAWFLHRLRSRSDVNASLLQPASTSTGRVLFAGGVLLVVIGFLHGAFYAGVDLYRQEEADYNILSRLNVAAQTQNRTALDSAMRDYGQLQADRAVKIAAHAHVIEFGFLAMLLAFFQPYVQLSREWQKRWACVMLAGSVMLPVCVLMELRFGLIAGGLADFGGLLVITALCAMWIGILRYTGKIDAMTGVAQ
ncbi:MAG TPA: hypothetical protein VE783_08120 [Candidatus Limnocylindrales bacterium]|nr:hypothetical protein [Candidatus Limnocylindrales bacterium]